MPTRFGYYMQGLPASTCAAGLFLQDARVREALSYTYDFENA